MTSGLVTHETVFPQVQSGKSQNLNIIACLFEAQSTLHGHQHAKLRTDPLIPFKNSRFYLFADICVCASSAECGLMGQSDSWISRLAQSNRMASSKTIVGVQPSSTGPECNNTDHFRARSQCFSPEENASGAFKALHHTSIAVLPQ